MVAMYTVDMASEGQVPFVYICATMWHETELEMVQLLTSLFRLDMDQADKTTCEDDTEGPNPGVYDFEAHIFFDDALEANINTAKAQGVNSHVRTFTNAVSLAARKVHDEIVVVKPPVKSCTPYGGRLEWNMPRGNKLTVHLKDKAKIRNKKRWSQVMSMQYLLLHHRIQERGHLIRQGQLHILHLDGDMDFSPQALIHLLNLMAQDTSIGAVCGRIHPTGQGSLVWCQRFEYSLSLWLQKTTEDVLGCVLCSPGCFSLLRGSALLDILPTFQMPSAAARDLLLQEQGEDRWLSSLLIQNGWKTRYSSISQSRTQAPETFEEFFKQRRRWTPSTFMHTLDLIVSWRNFTKLNRKMTLAFILYQAFLFLTSILASSTILLSLAAAGETLSNYRLPFTPSVLLSLIPIGAYAVVSLKASQHTQLQTAKVLSVCLALVQVLLLGTAIYQVASGGFCSPPILLLLCLCVSVLLAGLLHTWEFTEILYGVVYFFYIPCVYLVMVIYALSNLHIVVWGTREGPSPKEEGLSEEPYLAKPNFVMNGSNCDADIESQSLLMCSVDEDDEEVEHVLSTWGKCKHDMQVDEEQPPPYTEKVTIMETTKADDNDNEDSCNPMWILRRELGEGPVRNLSSEEEQFFHAVIQEHLSPLRVSPCEQKQISENLLSLRNRIVATFYLLNLTFIIGVLCLQAGTSRIIIHGVCGEETALEPRSVLMFFMFGTTYLVQFLGLIVHRTETLIRKLRGRRTNPKSCC